MATPTQIADRWAARLAASTEKIRQGVQAVTEAPTHKAAARSEAYAQGVQRAVSDGSYERGLLRVSLEDWKSKTLEVGIGRIAQGAAAAKGDFASFMGEFMPHVEAGQRQLDQLPRGDLEQNIARANAMIRHNATFRRNR